MCVDVSVDATSPSLVLLLALMGVGGTESKRLRGMLALMQIVLAHRTYRDSDVLLVAREPWTWRQKRNSNSLTCSPATRAP